MSAKDFLDAKYNKWPLTVQDTVNLMEEYAIESAKLSLQKASENVKMVDLNKSSKIPNSDYCWVVDPDSIKNYENINLA